MLVSSISSSELSDNSETFLAALSERAHSRKQKSVLKKSVEARPTAGSSARLKAQSQVALASAESPEPTAAPAALVQTARFGSGFDIDPATLQYYISVVERKGADRSQRALYFNVTEGLFRFVQPGSEI